MEDMSKKRSLFASVFRNCCKCLDTSIKHVVIQVQWVKKASNAASCEGMQHSTMVCITGEVVGCHSQCHSIPLGEAVLELNVVDEYAQGLWAVLFLWISDKSLKTPQNLFFEEIISVFLEFKYKNLDKPEANCTKAFKEWFVH